MISNQRYINSIYIQTKTINTTQIDIPNIEVFPSDDGLNVPSIETFPIYDDVDIPNIETFPIDESDEMDNIIFIDGATQAKNLNIPKSVARQVKKLSPEAKKSYDKAIEALKSRDTRGLHDHPLGGDRSGQRAIDIKGIG